MYQITIERDRANDLRVWIVVALLTLSGLCTTFISRRLSMRLSAIEELLELQAGEEAK